jgi:hypothetical protein
MFEAALPKWGFKLDPGLGGFSHGHGTNIHAPLETSLEQASVEAGGFRSVARRCPMSR